MANVKKTQKSKGGRKKKKGVLKGVLRIIFILAAVSAVVLAATKALGKVTFSNTHDSFKIFFEGLTPGPGYPNEIKSSDEVAFSSSGSGPILLTGESLSVFNSGAKSLFSEEHGFSSPAMSTVNGRSVVYDRSMKKLFVVSRTEKLNSLTTEQDVLLACIGSNGNVGVVTKAEKNKMCAFTVYDNEMLTRFRWESASDRIIACAISPNGKGAAVVTVGAKEAERYSKVFLFDFNKSEPVATFDYEAATVVSINYLSKDKLIVVSDELTAVISDNKSDVLCRYSTDVLYKTSVDESGKTALVLALSGSKEATRLRVFNKNATQLFERDYEERVLSVCASKRYTAVLLQGRLECLDNTGRLLLNVEANRDAKKIVLAGKNIYALTPTGIEKYSF